jgi:hypothetical protein
MEILSHRGYWKTPEEKNTRVAFERSFRLGFGTETDVRDRLGELVISHDMPDSNALSLDEFLSIYAEIGNDAPLALNIKADGLQAKLREALSQYQVENYFVFDMAVPDALGYLRADLTAFTRHSEYESRPSFYEQAAGVWLDCFHSEWFEAQDIRNHLTAGKEVCLVSPDLHRRPHEPFWAWLKLEGLAHTEGLMLCTDFPEAARAFFHGDH